VVLTFLPDYLSQQRGLSVPAATTVLLLFGLGGGLGVLAGGAAGQAIYNAGRKEGVALLMAASAWAGIGPLAWLLNADVAGAGLGAACVMAALAGAIASVPGPNLRAVMLNVNPPEARGVALALQSLTDDLGKGLGPAIAAGLVAALGRRNAFNVALCGWGPCGLLLGLLATCMRGDEAAMQAGLAAAARAGRARREAAAAADEREKAAGGAADGPAPLPSSSYRAPSVPSTRRGSPQPQQLGGVGDDGGGSALLPPGVAARGSAAGMRSSGSLELSQRLGGHGSAG
jgi:sugar phosphate permease